MNSNDFYKSKYSKYKNKYLELKQKNLKINQEGGMPLKPGKYLFYIPSFVIKDSFGCKIVQSNEELVMQSLFNIKAPLVGIDIGFPIKNLTCDDLYTPSILIIPIGEDDKISSIENWIIPEPYISPKINITPQISNTDSNEENYVNFFYSIEKFILENKKKVQFFKPITSTWEDKELGEYESVVCLKYQIRGSIGLNVLLGYTYFTISWDNSYTFNKNLDYKKIGEKAGIYLFYIPEEHHTKIIDKKKYPTYERLCQLSLLVIPFCIRNEMQKNCTGNQRPEHNILNTDKWILQDKTQNKIICKLKNLGNITDLTYPELFCVTKDCFKEEEYDETKVNWYKFQINPFLKKELLKHSDEPFSFNTLKKQFTEKGKKIKDITEKTTYIKEQNKVIMAQNDYIEAENARIEKLTDQNEINKQWEELRPEKVELYKQSVELEKKKVELEPLKRELYDMKEILKEKRVDLPVWFFTDVPAQAPLEQTGGGGIL